MPTQTIPSRTYPAGVTDFGPVNLTGNASQISLTLTRENWPAVGGNLISIQFEFSPDGGTTWGFLAAFTAPGGVIIKRDGNPLLISGIIVALPPGQKRQLRGTITTAAQFQTAITITWT